MRLDLSQFILLGDSLTEERPDYFTSDLPS
jgi:hypothetical protein